MLRTSQFCAAYESNKFCLFISRQYKYILIILRLPFFWERIRQRTFQQRAIAFFWNEGFHPQTSYSPTSSISQVVISKAELSDAMPLATTKWYRHCPNSSIDPSKPKARTH
jgi:hypothetical protein